MFCVFDDVGFSDFGCYGSEIETPNIDRLAAGGLRYTNFHTTALCSPTRAALLTGRNHHAVGMGSLANYDLGFDGYRGSISRSAALLPEILREAGWNSFAVGKWHLTPMHHTGPSGPFYQWPTQRGFDRFYGFMDGAMNHWEPFLTEDNHHVETPDTPDYHLTTDITDRAIRMVSDQQSVAPEKPVLPVSRLRCRPLSAPRPQGPDRRLRARVREGVGRDTGRPPRPAEGNGPRTGIHRTAAAQPRRARLGRVVRGEQRLFVRFQAAFAAMVTHTDREIGRLIDTLEKIGAMTNTIFVVMSDNGASQEGSQAGTLHQGRYFERAPMTLEQSIDLIDEIGETQWFNNYPLGWAMAGNTPCKFYKQNTHGGGVRDPLIIHWPDGLSDDVAGTIRHQFHHVSDLTPTVLDVLRTPLPATVNGVEQMPLHGTPMTYTFAEPDAPTRKSVQYFEMLGHRGIVAGGWKAVTVHDPRTLLDDDTWELYHLDEDFAELHDLADAEPTILARARRAMVGAGSCEQGAAGRRPRRRRNSAEAARAPGLDAVAGARTSSVRRRTAAAQHESHDHRTRHGAGGRLRGSPDLRR